MAGVVALVVAAGSGSRAGQDLPKQYVPVAGQPLLRHALQALLDHPRVDAVQVVIGSGQQAFYTKAVAGLDLLPPVIGGASRQQSVFNGLQALATTAPQVVLIHDAARPFLPMQVVDRLLAVLEPGTGAIPGLPVVDTIKRVNAHGLVVETPPRAMLRAVQTPQAFLFDDILQAHRQVVGLEEEFSDDAAVAERVGMQVCVVKGDAMLRKVTHPEDFAWAEKMARQWRAGA